jgi:hypothetical protein
LSAESRTLPRTDEVRSGSCARAAPAAGNGDGWADAGNGSSSEKHSGKRPIATMRASQCAWLQSVRMEFEFAAPIVFRMTIRGPESVCSGGQFCPRYGPALRCARVDRKVVASLDVCCVIARASETRDYSESVVILAKRGSMSSSSSRSGDPCRRHPREAGIHFEFGNASQEIPAFAGITGLEYLTQERIHGDHRGVINACVV